MSSVRIPQIIVEIWNEYVDKIHSEHYKRHRKYNFITPYNQYDIHICENNYHIMTKNILLHHITPLLTKTKSLELGNIFCYMINSIDRNIKSLKGLNHKNGNLII